MDTVKSVAGSVYAILKTLECSICLEFLETPVKIGCGHFFCKFCITEVLKSNYRSPCPLCKIPFTRRSIQKVKQRQSVIQAAKELISARGMFTNTNCANFDDKLSADNAKEKKSVDSTVEDSVCISINGEIIPLTYKRHCQPNHKKQKAIDKSLADKAKNAEKFYVSEFHSEEDKEMKVEVHKARKVPQENNAECCNKNNRLPETLFTEINPSTYKRHCQPNHKKQKAIDKSLADKAKNAEKFDVYEFHSDEDKEMKVEVHENKLCYANNRPPETLFTEIIPLTYKRHCQPNHKNQKAIDKSLADKAKNAEKFYVSEFHSEQDKEMEVEVHKAREVPQENNAECCNKNNRLPETLFTEINPSTYKRHCQPNHKKQKAIDKSLADKAKNAEKFYVSEFHSEQDKEMEVEVHKAREVPQENNAECCNKNNRLPETLFTEINPSTYKRHCQPNHKKQKAIDKSLADKAKNAEKFDVYEFHSDEDKEMKVEVHENKLCYANNRLPETLFTEINSSTYKRHCQPNHKKQKAIDKSLADKAKNAEKFYVSEFHSEEDKEMEVEVHKARKVPQENNAECCNENNRLPETLFTEINPSTYKHHCEPNHKKQKAIDKSLADKAKNAEKFYVSEFHSEEDKEMEVEVHKAREVPQENNAECCNKNNRLPETLFTEINPSTYKRHCQPNHKKQKSIDKSLADKAKNAEKFDVYEFHSDEDKEMKVEVHENKLCYANNRLPETLFTEINSSTYKRHCQPNHKKQKAIDKSLADKAKNAEKFYVSEFHSEEDKEMEVEVHKAREVPQENNAECCNKNNRLPETLFTEINPSTYKRHCQPNHKKQKAIDKSLAVKAKNAEKFDVYEFHSEEEMENVPQKDNTKLCYENNRLPETLFTEINPSTSKRHCQPNHKKQKAIDKSLADKAKNAEKFYVSEFHSEEDKEMEVEVHKARKVPQENNAECCNENNRLPETLFTEINPSTYKHHCEPNHKKQKAIDKSLADKAKNAEKFYVSEFHSEEDKEMEVEVHKARKVSQENNAECLYENNRQPETLFAPVSPCPPIMAENTMLKHDGLHEKNNSPFNQVERFNANMFKPSFTEKTKVIKRTCLTLDEISEAFTNSKSSGNSETICLSLFLSGDFRLNVCVSEETLNISVLKVVESDSFCGLQNVSSKNESILSSLCRSKNDKGKFNDKPQDMSKDLKNSSPSKAVSPSDRNRKSHAILSESLQDNSTFNSCVSEDMTSVHEKLRSRRCLPMQPYKKIIRPLQVDVSENSSDISMEIEDLDKKTLSDVKKLKMCGQ